MRWKTLLRTSRALGLVLLCCILFVVVKSVTKGTRAPSLQSNISTSGSKSKDGFCSTFPDRSNVVIALKTGATEAVSKLPMQMLTTLRCAQDVMIFSDLEQTIAGYQLHDALADIPLSVMEGNPEFDYYRKLKEAKKYGQLEKMLKGIRDPNDPEKLASWVLDKYKHLHMWEKLYETYPDKDWYMMFVKWMDADTYLVWPNLLTWLSQLPDPVSTKLYLGSEAYQEDVKFAHSGSGIIISQAAMYDLAYINKGMAALWDQPARDLCCGDLLTGIAMKNLSIPFKNCHPTINGVMGEKVNTLPFGKDAWCEPVVTLHHVEPHEMNQLANYELSRGESQPLIYVDLYNEFVRDVIPESLDDWDNLCNEYNQYVFAAESYDVCRSKCKRERRCMQYKYNCKQCVHCKTMHLGTPSEMKNGTTWKSGWLKDRFEDWIKRQPPCELEFPWVEKASRTIESENSLRV